MYTIKHSAFYRQCQIDIDFFNHKNFKSVETITLESIKYAEKNLFDIIFFDTAGRQVVDNKMMDELKSIAQKLSPQETILVVDSLTGQDAVNIAKSNRPGPVWIEVPLDIQSQLVADKKFKFYSKKNNNFTPTDLLELIYWN